MTHLTYLELLALAERKAPADSTAPSDDAADADAATSAHVDDCGECRRKLAELRDALDLAAAVDVPEPSPLFWDHLSARVRSGIMDEDVQPGGDRAWVNGWPFKLAAAAAVVIAIAIAAASWRAPERDGVREIVAESQDPALREREALAGTTDADADQAWALVRDAADE